MAKGLVNKKRVRPMGTGDHGAGPVVYWCSRDQRVEDNWALIHACDTAKQAGVPCVVVFSLVTEFLGAGARQFGFMLRGLREMEAELKKKGIPFVLIKGNPGVTVPKFANDTAAHSVVMDQSPLRLGREWRETIAEKATCPSSEVDAHNVVPVWEASPKMEVGARTLRGKLLKLYPEFLVEYPEVPDVSGAMKLFASEALTSAIQKNSHDWDKTIALAVDAGKSVPEVTWAVPGETAALIVLDNFLTRRLKLYESRNDPAKPQCLSGLSPYLHFGQISGARCAMEAKKFSKSAPKAVEVFFEELVVRRELADNFCWYSPKYDTLDGQKYDWAKDTLQLHAKDKRPYLYSKEEFETAKTRVRRVRVVHRGGARPGVEGKRRYVFLSLKILLALYRLRRVPLGSRFNTSREEFLIIPIYCTVSQLPVQNTDLYFQILRLLFRWATARRRATTTFPEPWTKTWSRI